MQFTPEGNDQIATSYEIAGARLRLAWSQTSDRMARQLLFHQIRRWEKAAEWHRARAATDRRLYAEKTKP